MSFDVSIIICTRNRAESLRPTLLSIGAVQVPAGWAVELLVVDNGSTDHTAAVVKETVLANVQVRYVNETQAGQCYARNRGLRDTSGDIILFTDDDVRVPPNWIQGMCQPIRDGVSDGVAGGIIFPPRIGYIMSKPPLLLFRGWFACSEYLNPDRPVNMIGANMAFHRRVLAQIPEFDTNLGPGALGFFDEALFSWRLLGAGFKISGALEVALEHHFDLSRVTYTSLLELARKMGRSRAYIFHHWYRRRSRLILLHLAWAHVRLQAVRIAARFATGKRAQYPSVAHIRLEEAVAFGHGYLALRRTAPRYPKKPAVAVQPAVALNA